MQTPIMSPKCLLDFIMGNELHILNKGTEPSFLDSGRQEVMDITICMKHVMNLVRDWRVFSEPSGSDHRHLKAIQLKEKLGHNSRQTDWMGYRPDLQSQLCKAPSRFHTKENLEVASQYISHAISNSY